MREQIEKNQLFLGTTDTIIGLFAPANKAGCLLLDTIKGRSNKPYILLIGSIEEAKKYIILDKNGIVEQCMSTFWPNPITIICRSKEDSENLVGAKNRTIALRWPNHQGIQALLKEVPALLSTSANLSGELVPETMELVSPHITQQISTAIDGYTNESARKTARHHASTIIDFSGTHVTLCRQGTLFPQALKAMVDQPLHYE